MSAAKYSPVTHFPSWYNRKGTSDCSRWNFILISRLYKIEHQRWNSRPWNLKMSRLQTLERKAQITRSARPFCFGRRHGGAEGSFLIRIAHAPQVIVLFISILQSNTKKDRTIQDAITKYTIPMVAGGTPGVLSRYVVVVFCDSEPSYLIITNRILSGKNGRSSFFSHLRRYPEWRRHWRVCCWIEISPRCYI
jgi:hypothetical protein